MHQYKFQMPAVTADIIVYRYADGKLQVLLVKRAKDPFKDAWAIPGGHLDVETDPNIASCAARELKEETNIDVDFWNLMFIRFYDQLHRDPRGRYITFAYCIELPAGAEVQAADDAKEFDWFDVNDIKSGKVKVAFDHQKIIEDFHYHNRERRLKRCEGE